MNPSYFRIKAPLEDAKRRLAHWLGVSELKGLIATDGVEAISLACTPAGTWRGPALFFYENQGWTVFEDVSGQYSATPAESWLAFAQTEEFVFAGYNDAILYGELVVISNGVVCREFLEDADESDGKVNRGQLPEETDAPIASWIEVASFVDSDPLYGSDEGWLYMPAPG